MSESKDEKGMTKVVIGIWPVILLVCVIFGFFFITILSHAEKITKNETNIENIMSVVCRIDRNVDTIKDNLP